MPFFVPGGAALPPPGPTVGGTLVSAIKSFAGGGGAAGAAGVVAGAIGTAIGGPVGGIIASQLVSLVPMETKSKANWNRTLGRVFRAAVLGYVPSIDGAAPILRQIKAAWLASGDASGAQFWDRVVNLFGVPTEKGGTKKGFGAGAPAGSNTAEAQPGFSAGLRAFIAAVG